MDASKCAQALRVRSAHDLFMPCIGDNMYGVLHRLPPSARATVHSTANIRSYFVVIWLQCIQNE
jgi:hypothetical protein